MSKRPHDEENESQSEEDEWVGPKQDEKEETNDEPASQNNGQSAEEDAEQQLKRIKKQKSKACLDKTDP